LAEYDFAEIFMKKINVIDFDKTLIRYDSFRLYCFILLFHGSKKIKVLKAIVFRLLRIHDTASFKAIIHSLSDDNFLKSSHFESFVDKLFSDINPLVLNSVREQSLDGAINVLVSASPKFYIERVASKLGWEFIASNTNGSKFLHMYGKEKLKNVISTYPKREYIYNFALSDSESDLQLLHEFNTFKLIQL